MTEQHGNNPLAKRTSSNVPATFVSTPSSVQQLHDHCDRLNRLNWVIASGKPYLVRFHPTLGKHEVYRQGEVLEEAV